MTKQRAIATEERPVFKPRSSYAGSLLAQPLRVRGLQAGGGGIGVLSGFWVLLPGAASQQMA